MRCCLGVRMDAILTGVLESMHMLLAKVLETYNRFNSCRYATMRIIKKIMTGGVKVSELISFIRMRK